MLNLSVHLFGLSNCKETSTDFLESATFEGTTGNDFLLTVGDSQFNYGCRGIGQRSY